MDRQMEIQAKIWTERQRETEEDREMDRYRQIDSQVEVIQKDKNIYIEGKTDERYRRMDLYRKTNKLTGRQLGLYTNRQTDRPMDR